MTKPYLNLGCGARFHQDWENVDFVATAPGVRAYDLRAGIPYPDASFDIVYHSHLLEHLPKEAASAFLRECYRVLKPAGTIRVAVPDLERIARLYLEALEKSLGGETSWKARYEWILLEMYDQTVRETPGGEMLAYVRRNPIPEKDFVAARLGGELQHMTTPKPPPLALNKTSNFSLLRNFISRKVARLTLGREGIRTYDSAKFRQSGEIHRWMYDRYSLANALRSAGFINPVKVGPADSRIPSWTAFHLDTEPDGRTYKPDSLFMEATRP
jgi:SAM-dependent methyltransferase